MNKIIDLANNEDGVVLLQASLILPVILIFSIGLAALCVTIFRGQALQYVLADTARFASIGGLSVSEIETHLINEASIHGLEISGEMITICPISSTCTATTDNLGISGEKVEVNVQMPLTNLFNTQFLTLAFNFNKSVIIRNEPF